ncbi:SpaA isopeptide-forming pilin-related protein [Enterococcus hirae]|nr:SpaA isopeptide-forming pilin-related protein [Enterococcus hirae]
MSKLTANAKLVSVLMLLALLIPYAINVMIAFPRDVEAKSTNQTLVANDDLRVSAGYEEKEDGVEWTLEFEKALAESRGATGRVKFQISENATISSDAGMTQEENWWKEKDFSSTSNGKMVFTTPKSDPNPKVSVQMDEHSRSMKTREAIKENVLTKAEEGAHELKAELTQEEDEDADAAETMAEQTDTAGGQTTAAASTRASASGYNLIISPTVVDESLSVTSKAASEAISNEWKPNTLNKTPTGDPDFYKGSYKSASEALNANRTYVMFNKIGAGHAVGYNNKAANGRNPYQDQINAANQAVPFQFKAKDGTMVNEELEFIYQQVGSYQDANGQLQPVGAKVTFKNMYIGPHSDWASAKGDNHMPWLELSHNMYSGIIYGFFHKFDLDLEFFDAKTDQTIDFVDSNDQKATFTFASLNGYENRGDTAPKKNTYNPQEFAGMAASASQHNVGTLSSNSQLSFDPFSNNSQKYPVHSSNAYFANSYYAGKLTDFDDYLGSSNFQDAAVSLPMVGTVQHYKFGSTWGRAWNTFAAMDINKPIEQGKPTKTVIQTKLYQAGDKLGNPTGKEPGFAERYYNDLDSFGYDGTNLGSWELDSTRRVDGHDADDLSSLLSYLPKKAERNVETGQTHYYFINQAAIDLHGASMLTPDKVLIKDELPEGMQFESANILENAVLYNIDGTVIDDPFDNDSSISTNLRSITLSLKSSTIDAIHKLKGENPALEDYAVRLKVKVTNHVNDNINDFMVNQATVDYRYTAAEKNFEHPTNQVQTFIKDQRWPLEFVKRDATNWNVKLSGVEFELWTDKDKTGTKIGQGTSDNDGKVIMENLDGEQGFEEGTYWLHETDGKAGWIPGDALEVVIDKDGNITGLEEDELGLSVFNQSEPFRLELAKSLYGKGLADVTFKLEHQGNFAAYSATTAKDGSLIFDSAPDGLVSGTYRLSETSSPAGINPINKTWLIELGIHDDGEHFATIQEEATGASVEKLTVQYDASMHRWIAKKTDEAGTIVNELKPFALNVVKKDQTNDKALAGAEFGLYEAKQQESGQLQTGELISKATSKSDGKIQFFAYGKEYRLAPNTFYAVKEESAPSGYITNRETYFFKTPSDLTAGALKFFGADGKVIQNDPLASGTIGFKPTDALNEIDMTFANKRKARLPLTGSNEKMILFAASGASLLAGLAVLYLHGKRKREVE